ncbi:MAG: hypothetical protein HY077_03525 [Elusimicrobia bacterium]|nr:hypothetical protein [Elusimicrobiota bacterium]
MAARRTWPVLLAPVLIFAACIGYVPDTPRTVSYETVNEPVLHDSMGRSSVAGPLNIDAVVYKPTLPPLSGVMKKLSRRQYKKALREAHLRYEPSNIDDAALKALVKHGYIPVLVDILNTGDESVDLHRLKLSLRDGTKTREPIPSEKLPKSLTTPRPQAAITNIYNASLVTVGYATMLVYALAVVVPDHASYRIGRVRGRYGDRDSQTVGRLDAASGGPPADDLEAYSLRRDFYGALKYEDSKVIDRDGNPRSGRPVFDLDGRGSPPPKHRWHPPEYIAGMDMSLDNETFSALAEEFPVEYNGLLYRPALLAPGKSTRGLLFFKAKGADWTDLRLQGELIQPEAAAR